MHGGNQKFANLIKRPGARRNRKRFGRKSDGGGGVSFEAAVSRCWPCATLRWPSWRTPWRAPASGGSWPPSSCGGRDRGAAAAMQLVASLSEAAGHLSRGPPMLGSRHEHERRAHATEQHQQQPQQPHEAIDDQHHPRSKNAKRRKIASLCHVHSDEFNLAAEWYQQASLLTRQIGAISNASTSSSSSSSSSI